MIRWLGFGLVILGSAAVGLAVSWEMEKRLVQLREMRRMVEMLEGEIRCANSTLSECFHHVAGRTLPPFDTFLENMAEHMEEFRGDTVQEIFRQHVEQDLSDTALLTEDLEQLKRLGEQLGYLDVQMQLGALTLYQNQLEDSYKRAAEAYVGKAKLCRYLGLMGGLFLAIIFI